MQNKFRKVILILAIVAAIAALYFVLRGRKEGNDNQVNTVNLPAENQPETAATPAAENKSEENQAEPAQAEPAPAEKPAASIPEKYLLDMPFYSQAPLSNWDKVHEEMCEEASVLNAGLFLTGKKLSAADFDKELMKIKKIEEKLFNDYKSTTVAQTKQFTDAYFGQALKTKIIDNPTIKQIEAEVSAGHPVVVPLAGRDIGNPNFTPPGPVYHMLVIKSYDAQNFITNDVGTRKGNSYVYRKAVIMQNMHDWNEADIHSGMKRILVLSKP